MGKIVVAHQPEFLPYLGFFHRLLKADLLIIADDVQYEKQNYQNRNRIKTARGEKWITASLTPHSYETKINQICLSRKHDWRNEHLCLVKENYRKAPFFKEVYPFIEQLYQLECEKLLDFNIYTLNMLCKMFDIEIETIMSSTLDAQGKKNTLIVDMLKKIGAAAYISGDGAKKYYDPVPFEKAGIEVIWQNFKHPVYPQINGEFLPNMSSIDLFFNCGIEHAREILRS